MCSEKIIKNDPHNGIPYQIRRYFVNAAKKNMEIGRIRITVFNLLSFSLSVSAPEREEIEFKSLEFKYKSY